MTSHAALMIRAERYDEAINRVILPFLRGALVAFLLILAYGVLSHQVEAATEQATSAKVKQQAAYIAALEKTLATCLSGGDKAITIGEEIWMCGASNTGIRVK